MTGLTNLYKEIYISPLGNIVVTADDSEIHQITFAGNIPEGLNSPNLLTEEAVNQLKLYFSKKLQKFSLPLQLGGSDFQRRVLEEVQKIPYGQTVTYTQLAMRLGSLKLTRAVAAANAKNQNLIMIPCHRVIGKNNDLTGYAGELWRKQWLLNHEQATNAALF